MKAAAIGAAAAGRRGDFQTLNKCEAAHRGGLVHLDALLELVFAIYARRLSDL
jgi:hypothetical protein